MRTRIMYLEWKGERLSGTARIGRVSFSKTGRTLTYQGRSYQRGSGFKSNHFDTETGEEIWISGPRRDGHDRLFGERRAVPIDDDVREEHWTTIRRSPEHALRTDARL